MASLKALKIRIGSVKSTQKITKAMNMVAAAKLRRAQQNADGRHGLIPTRMTDVVRSLAVEGDARAAEPEAARRHGQGRHAPDRRRHRDRGLAGAFNSNIVRAARRKAEELMARARRSCSTSSAARAARCSSASIPKAIIAQFDTSEMKNPSYADAQAIAKDIIDRYTTDGIDVVHLAYANFRSTLVQEPTIDQIIPVAPAEPKTRRSRPRRSACRGRI